MWTSEGHSYIQQGWEMGYRERSFVYRDETRGKQANCHICHSGDYNRHIKWDTSLKTLSRIIHSSLLIMLTENAAWGDNDNSLWSYDSHLLNDWNHWVYYLIYRYTKQANIFFFLSPLWNQEPTYLYSKQVFLKNCLHWEGWLAEMLRLLLTCSKVHFFLLPKIAGALISKDYRLWREITALENKFCCLAFLQTEIVINKVNLKTR